jgi:hypothetical protein
MGRGVWRDLRAPSDLVLADDLLLFRDCSRKALIVFDCDLSVVPKKSMTGDATANLSFLALSLPKRVDEAEIRVLQSKSEPTYVTTDIGLSELPGRVVVLALAVLVLGGLAILVLVRLPMALRSGKAISQISNATLEAVVIPVTYVDMKIAGSNSQARTVGCEWVDEGRKIAYGIVLKSAEKPYFVGCDMKSAVAVRRAGSPAPLVVDTTLWRLNLSDEEKRRFHEAVAVHVAKT